MTVSVENNKFFFSFSHRSKKWWRRIFHYLMMAAAHNTYTVAKDSNPGYVNSEWPGFLDFLEDLAEDPVCDVTTVRAPPIIHSVRPTQHLNTLKLRDDSFYKVCYESKLLGLKGKTSKTMCAICKVPVQIGCLQIHQKRML